METYPLIFQVQVIIGRMNNTRQHESFATLQEAIEYLEDLQTKEYSRGNPVEPKDINK